MHQFVIQFVIFIIIGATVCVLSELLRCKQVNVSVANPKRSSLQALTAVAVSMLMISILAFKQYLQHGPTQVAWSGPDQMRDLIPQLVVLLVYGAPATIFLVKSSESLQSVGITTKNLWQAVVIGLGLAWVTFYLQPGGFFAKIVKLDSGHGISFIFYAFVGFGEEFLFRGYLQTRLVSWIGRWKGLILASVIMAFLHLPDRILIEGMSFGQGANSCLGLIPLSLLMGIVMIRLGNIVAPGLFHTFANWARTLT